MLVVIPGRGGSRLDAQLLSERARLRLLI